MEGDLPNHFNIEMNFPDYLKAKLGSTKALWRVVDAGNPASGFISVESQQMRMSHLGLLHDLELRAGTGIGLCARHG